MGAQQVLPELVEEHLVALLVAAIVLRVLFLDAVVGQVAGHVLEVGAVVGLRGRPQHTLPVKVDVVLMVHEHPAPKNTTANPQSQITGKNTSENISYFAVPQTA